MARKRSLLVQEIRLSIFKRSFLDEFEYCIDRAKIQRKTLIFKADFKHQITARNMRRPFPFWRSVRMGVSGCL